jgi:Kef-type K+ transport system membrane component KefB
MGIALTCGQLAGGGVVGIVAMVAESRLRLKRFETHGIGLDPEWLAGLGILIGVAAVLAALSATAMAPSCRAPIRWLLAWTIGALPVAIGLLAIVTASGTLNPMPWRRTPQTGIIAILLALAATLFLSFILAIAFNLIYARLQRSAARKYRRKHEQSVRGLSGVLLRPQVMQVPSL